MGWFFKKNDILLVFFFTMRVCLLKLRQENNKDFISMAHVTQNYLYNF